MKINRVLCIPILMMWSTSMDAQKSVLYGDVNGDELLTKKDVTLLSEVITGKVKSYANPSAADFNQDGTIDIEDLTLLIDAILHPSTGKSNGYTWVDLGLSVKWATCNVGANSPEEYGDYYAWGESSTKSSYTWSNYLADKGGTITSWNDCGTSKDPLRYYVYPYESSIAATMLDVAHRLWKGEWRMPTFDEMKELLKNCYWKWTNNYNGTRKAGYIIYKVKAEADKGKYSYGYTAPIATYSLSDTHIFLPASGYRSGSELYDAGNIGHYWSADPTTGSAADVFTLSFDSSFALWLSYFRNDGFSVRPVIK